MTSATQSRKAIIDAFFQQHHKIPFVIATSPGYAAFRATYMLDNPAVPIGIARPRNAQDVSLIVSYCASHGVPFVARSGGHSLFGTSQVHDALTIDMRDINYCNIDDNKQSAKIGGGILAGKLVEDLTWAGLATASGMASTVGYIGWSTYGGYGPYSGKLGYGFEQILGARIVTWNGDIIDANDELLRGIRGAGGAFGIIVELTIKVYPITKISTGVMQYDTSDVKATVTSYCRGLQKLRDEGYPRELCIAPLFFSTPGGMQLASHFMWGSDDRTSALEWLGKASNLGRVTDCTVRESTVYEGMKDFNTIIPPDGQGSVNTVNLRTLNDEVTAIIATYVEAMPRYVGNGFAIHVAPKPSDASFTNSVFGATESHYMLEFVGTPRSKEGLEESKKWVANFVQALLKTDPRNILETTSLNHTPPGRTTLDKLYGKHFPFVKSIKRKYDPKNIFNLAVPFSYIHATEEQLIERMGQL